MHIGIEHDHERGPTEADRCGTEEIVRSPNKNRLRRHPILHLLSADGPERAYEHMSPACSIIRRPTILGVGSTTENLIPHLRLETSRWPNTETACDILRDEPRRESTRFYRYKSSGRPLDRSLQAAHGDTTVLWRRSGGDLGLARAGEIGAYARKGKAGVAQYVMRPPYRGTRPVSMCL